MSGKYQDIRPHQNFVANICASSIRQVPDNQEVYLERDGFTSVIFDIMERVEQDQAANDEEALKFHYADMVGDSNDATQFWHSNVAVLSRMP